MNGWHGMQLRRRRVQQRVQIALWRERTHRPSTPRFHASDRPAAPPRRRWVLLSIGIPSQRFRWFQGEPAAQPLAARECLRQKPAAAEAGVGKDAKKTQKQLEQATR